LDFRQNRDSYLQQGKNKETFVSASTQVPRHEDISFTQLSITPRKRMG